VKGKKREEWDSFHKLDDRFDDWLKPDQDRWNRIADDCAAEAAT
jgi:hypothetical protein